MSRISRRAVLLAGGLAGTANAVCAAAGERLRAIDLRTALRTEPLGIGDARPGLSWRLEGPAGIFQSAYRIIVATSRGRLERGVADLWDSGRVEGETCVGISYGGAPLEARRRCHWRVMVWDAAGAPSDWSAPAAFEVGLLHAHDWGGDWIAVESGEERADRQAGAPWVTASAAAPEPGCGFRLAFRSAAGPGRLVVAAGGKLLNLALDGRPLASPPRDPNAWGDAPAASFSLDLAAGDHLLTADVRPGKDASGQYSARLAGQVTFVGDDGAARRVSDGWEARADGQGAWREAARTPDAPAFPWPPSPARLLRRAFRLARVPARARLYVSVLGGYRLWINGQRVGDDELQSASSEYHRRAPYRVYDVTALLRAGDNVVGALVGDGFYASYQAPDGRYAYGPAPRRLRLMIEFDGGPAGRIVSDDRWRHRASPVSMSEIYAGEDQDLRLWPQGWSEPGFDDGDWPIVWGAPDPKLDLAAPLAEPVREIKVLKPVSIRSAGPGRHLVDFGQNFAGRVRLTINGRRGDVVSVRHAEILDAAGRLDRRNLRAARAQDNYVLAGEGREVLQPFFTYQGFRYAEIEGPQTLSADRVEGVVLSSNLRETGVFRTAEPIVQKLWLNTLWSQRSNFMGAPTDCPQRDERLGWTGDAQVFWETAAFNMDVGAYTRAYTRMLRDDQAPNGAYPMWSPSPRGLGWGSREATPGWADAGVMLPFIAFLHGGDRAVIDENWPAMSAYLTGILADNPDGLWRKGRGADLGDWLALDAKWPGDETTPKALIASAMLARSIEQVARMAAWTGRAAEAERWRRQLQVTRTAFARAYVAGDGQVGNDSHTSYILALRLGLVPASLRQACGRRLAAAIAQRGGLLTTGFLGTPLALDALADVGQDRLAFDLLLRTDFPSWGYMAKHGATTIWERWNGDTGDVWMNSFNHYALGAVCAFLYRRVAGLEPVEPGFKRIRFAPLADPRLGAASAWVDSVRGRFEGGWRMNGDQVEAHLRVPANSRADVRLPGVSQTVGPGAHRFAFRLAGRA